MSIKIFLGRIVCLLFSHKYVLTQKLSLQSRRMACTRCHQMFAMNDDIQCLIDWDASFHQMYESQGVKIKYQPWEGKP